MTIVIAVLRLAAFDETSGAASRGKFTEPVRWVSPFAIVSLSDDAELVWAHRL